MRCATSYWAASPVPISPMAAKRTDPGFWGRMTSCAHSDRVYRFRSAARRKVRRRIVRIGLSARKLRKGSWNKIDDDSGFNVLQDEIVTDDSVGEFWR